MSFAEEVVFLSMFDAPFRRPDWAFPSSPCRPDRSIQKREERLRSGGIPCHDLLSHHRLRTATARDPSTQVFFSFFDLRSGRRRGNFGRDDKKEEAIRFYFAFVGFSVSVVLLLVLRCGKVCMITSESFFQTLTRLDGYYECPIRGGERLGPLVGYAQRDEQGRQYVGEIYADCSVLERSPRELRKVVVEIRAGMILHFTATKDDDVPNAVVAMPFGGLSTGLMLAESLDDEVGDCAYLFPEIELTPSERAGEKPKKTLVFGRHEPREGMRVVLAEDVCNAFSTTAKAIALVEKYGARVVGIACLLNRSSQHKSVYTLPDARQIPIFAAVQKPMLSYRQDDKKVAADVARGNVVWHPKKDRAALVRAMAPKFI